MQREHRQLHAESHQEAQIAEQAKGAARRSGDQLAEVEGEGPVQGQGQAAHQDQKGGGRGVKDEFGGGVLPLLASPDRDQEINGHQLQLPGQEEQQEVLGEEHQRLGRGLQQQQGEVKAGFLLDVPARRHRQQGDQAGEHHQRSREPIGGQGPFQADGRHPGEALHQLKAGDGTVVVLAVDKQHQSQVRQQGDQGNGAGKFRIGSVPRQQHHQRSHHRRQQGDQAEPGKAGWSAQQTFAQSRVTEGAGERRGRGHQGQVGVHHDQGYRKAKARSPVCIEVLVGLGSISRGKSLAMNLPVRLIMPG